MSRTVTPATSLDNLRKEAKRWLKALHDGNAAARLRFDAAWANAPANPVLRDVQHALAREYSQENWRALTLAVKQAHNSITSVRLEENVQYAKLADDLVAAFNNQDAEALQRLNVHYGRTFSFQDLGAEVWRRLYSYRQRAFSKDREPLLRSEAEILIAQNAGFPSWEALLDLSASRPDPVPAYVLDLTEKTIAPARQMTNGDWDRMLAAMREHRITTLESSLTTDAALTRIADLDHITSLRLNGSRALTDEGVQVLARMPQLRHVNLSDTNLTDRGLDVLRHLPNLERFEMTWHRGLTDAGAAQLRWCERLEHVDLMGTFTGDGVIEALQGKPSLRHLSTGRQVTDRGLGYLTNVPAFTTWRGQSARRPDSPDNHFTRLLVDGPFTDAGMARLAALDGVAALDLFWHVTAITAAGFAELIQMRNLESLGADGALTDDTVFEHLGRMPRLRWLRAQETHATDCGFVALSRSPSLEGIWSGRDEVALGNRGFLALAAIPTLSNLGVNCSKVDDAALSALPRMAVLQELTPIGFTDGGFRHVGRCEKLTRLSCMYCRDTTDLATEEIAALQLRHYYAGLTKITDRSLEILGAMPTLEDLEFYETGAVTNVGLTFLATLPNLRRIGLTGLPHVTFEGTRIFPARVQVQYST